MSTRIPREKAVFVEAPEIADPEQRSQFLDQACGADEAFREQVEKLLALSQSAGDFFSECRPALEELGGKIIPVIAADGTFLKPNVQDEMEDWGNRARFLAAYQKLKDKVEAT